LEEEKKKGSSEKIQDKISSIIPDRELKKRVSINFEEEALVQGKEEKKKGDNMR
jgi:hypothetical protein